MKNWKHDSLINLLSSIIARKWVQLLTKRRLFRRIAPHYRCLWSCPASSYLWLTTFGLFFFFHHSVCVYTFFCCCFFYDFADEVHGPYHGRINILSCIRIEGKVSRKKNISKLPSTVDSRYLEVQRTFWNTSWYPYLDKIYLQNWG